MKGVFEKYLLALRKTPVEEKTEHTDRSALEMLLQAIAEEVATGVHVQHEPKRDGRPRGRRVRAARYGF